MIQDNFALTGALTIEINNTVVHETKNLVVTIGKEWVASRMKDTVSGGYTQKSQMSHMAIGTDTTPNSGATVVAAGNTALVTEKDRNALTTAGGAVGTTASTKDEIVYTCTWAAGDGTDAITEAGIFNAATNGDMLARTKFAVVNKGVDDSMTITWTITVS
jgi:hypothetical protein